MEEKKLRALLRERLHLELCLFEDTLLRKTKKEIYGAYYAIEVFISLYDILQEEAEALSGGAMQKLLYRESGILESFYRQWMELEERSLDQLWPFVSGELEILEREIIHACRKGEEDGTVSVQAA